MWCRTQRFMRQADVDLLVGDASKAGYPVGMGNRPWISRDLVATMVEADMDLVARTKVQ